MCPLVTTAPGACSSHEHAWARAAWPSVCSRHGPGTRQYKANPHPRGTLRSTPGFSPPCPALPPCLLLAGTAWAKRTSWSTCPTMRSTTSGGARVAGWWAGRVAEHKHALARGWRCRAHLGPRSTPRALSQPTPCPPCCLVRAGRCSCARTTRACGTPWATATSRSRCGAGGGLRRLGDGPRHRLHSRWASCGGALRSNGHPSPPPSASPGGQNCPGPQPSPCLPPLQLGLLDAAVRCHRRALPYDKEGVAVHELVSSAAACVASRAAVCVGSCAAARRGGVAVQCTSWRG